MTLPRRGRVHRRVLRGRHASGQRRRRRRRARSMGPAPAILGGRRLPVDRVHRSCQRARVLSDWPSGRHRSEREVGLARQPVDSLRASVGRREKMESIGIETSATTDIVCRPGSIGRHRLRPSRARGRDPSRRPGTKTRKSVGAQCSYGLGVAAAQFGDLAAKLTRQAVERAEKLKRVSKVMVGLKIGSRRQS